MKPVYPSKEWQWMSDDEVLRLFSDLVYNPVYSDIESYKALEAKLMEQT